MSERHPVDPVTKAAEASALPRAAGVRARAGAATDPVPEGKEVAVGPVHHFNAVDDPHAHDRDRAAPTDPAALDLVERRAQAAAARHGEDAKHRQHVPNRSAAQAGVDYRGSATQANKLMDSRHRGGDYGGQRSAAEDSTRRSAHKGKN